MKIEEDWSEEAEHVRRVWFEEDDSFRGLTNALRQILQETTMDGFGMSEDFMKGYRYRSIQINKIIQHMETLS